MVYSGYVCFYGFVFKSREALVKYLSSYIGIPSEVAYTILLARKHCQDNVWSQVPRDIVKLIFSYVKPDLTYMLDDENVMVDEFDLRPWGYDFEFDRNRCCYDNGEIYFGYSLGQANVVYRNSVDEYDTFEEYHQSKTTEMMEIMRYFYKNQTRFVKNFAKLPPLDPAKPKFFTFADDCEHCS